MSVHRESSLLAANLLLLMFHLLLKFESTTSFQGASPYVGTCGNSLYDSKNRLASNRDGKPRDGIDYYDDSNETTVPPEFRKKPIKPFSETQTRMNVQERAHVARLASEPVIVKLNFVYDKSFAPEPRVLKHLRALAYQLQLIYEQPEMSQRIKFNFVVVSIKASSVVYARHLDTNAILDTFHRGPDANKDADINVLLLFRTIWDVPNKSQRKVIGLAFVGSFCRRGGLRSVIVHAPTLGFSVTLAHEIGHAFNCQHDGESKSKIEAQCNSERDIMSPSHGPTKLRWSKCTVDCIANNFLDQDVAKCIYDPDRKATARPFNKQFDFTPIASNKNRRPFPGELMSIDEQCKQALDEKALSALTQFKSNGRGSYDTCQELVCAVGPSSLFEAGPAPTGSRCDFPVGGGLSSNLSMCHNTECVNYTPAP